MSQYLGVLIQNQKGIAPIIVVVGIVFGLTFIGGGYVVSNQLAAGTPRETVSENRAVSIDDLNLGKIDENGVAPDQIKADQSVGGTGSSVSPSPTPKPLNAFERLLQRFNMQPKSTPMPSTLTPKPTATTASTSTVTVSSPQASATATPTPTPIPTTNTTTSTTSYTTETPSPTPAIVATPSPSPTFSGSAVCEVHTNPTSGTAPLAVQLIYGMSANGYVGVNPYVKEVQWDWDGDGNWDTDYSVNNQQLSHTYDTPGTYSLRMHLKLNGGYETQVCTGSITIN